MAPECFEGLQSVVTFGARQPVGRRGPPGGRPAPPDSRSAIFRFPTARASPALSSESGTGNEPGRVVRAPCDSGDDLGQRHGIGIGDEKGAVGAVSRIITCATALASVSSATSERRARNAAKGSGQDLRASAKSAGEIALDLRPVEQAPGARRRRGWRSRQRLLRFQLGAAVRIRGMRGIIIGDGEMPDTGPLCLHGRRKERRKRFTPACRRRLRQRPGWHRG